MRSFIGPAALALVVATAVTACGAPAELTPDQIVAAFIAASQDDARTMHMEWHGTIHTSQQTNEPGLTESDATLDATFEFSGADYEGVLTTSSASEFGDSGSTISYAQVGGVTFTRYAGGAWQLSDASAVAPMQFDPLTGLTATDITYEAPETLDGRQVHRLRVNDPLGVLERTLLPVGGIGEIGPIEGGASDYVVFVDALGNPVEARMRVDVRMQMIDPTVAGAEVEYGFTSEYVISDWGAPITIIAPPITGGGFDDKPPQPLAP